MNDDTKVKYTFTNEHNEVAIMVFTMMQIEGIKGGFIKHVLEILKDLEFGVPKEIKRCVN